MRNLRNPKWIFIINTIPVIILFLLYFGQYSIIKTLLEEKNLVLWKVFGISLAGLSSLHLIYGVYATINKQKVSFIYALFALLTYIPFIYLFSNRIDSVIPFSIPGWMISDNLFLYVGTFLMPTLVYSLFILVLHFTPEDKEYAAWKNFLFAIIIPLFWYFFLVAILPLWKFNFAYDRHIFLVLLLIGTVIFLFFLVRGIYIIALKRNNFWTKYQLVWKIPVSIIMPLAGLAMNNGYLFGNEITHNSGIFGNFNDIWFYVLAILNGVLICLPNMEHKLYRLLLYIGRSITFSYTLYFFLVFLPFLPLSIIAIIAVGAGFLMLTPLLLFVIHTQALSKDFTYLKEYYSGKMMGLFSFAGMLIIPIVISISYLNDKSVLNESLEYIYTPDYSKDYRIDTVSLQKTLTEIIKHKKKRFRGNDFGGRIPYLSSYFNWLVMDNLTLSDAKINKIGKVFFDKTYFRTRKENIRNSNVNISEVTTQSTYDSEHKQWISQVNLEINNNNNSGGFSEYATTIELPVGCWISDYYLYVGDKKEMGILAEKKTAKWVFSQIRNTNRDPGILYYLTGNKVALRVFPFAKNEMRKTGFELIHKEPVQFNIDGNVVRLGDQMNVLNEDSDTDNVIYVSALQKQSLQKVQRKPYFHFLIDVSKENQQNLKDFTNRIERLLTKHKDLSKGAKISLVNTYVSTFNINDDWHTKLENQDFEGGFNLDRAIKKTLYDSYLEKAKHYPVMVVVTDSIQDAVLEKDFSDLKITFPESNLFYNLLQNDTLEAHSLISNPKRALPEQASFAYNKPVLQYVHKNNSVSYLPDNNKPSILLSNDRIDISEKEVHKKDWKTALQMQGKLMSQALHPETSNNEWRQMLKYSFMSKIMTPLTSYLVVENEAQKAMLKKKQEQVLSGNKSLDIGDEAQRMSEPNLLIITMLFSFIVFIIERRKRKLKAR